MPVQRRKWINRQMLRDEPRVLFVFGDNLERWGKGGQAAEMRGEPNAVGLPTKRSPYTFLTDTDYAEVQRAVIDDLARLRRHLADDGVVVWPEDGVGTGLAQLSERAPGIKQFYDLLLLALIEIKYLDPPG